MLRGRDARAANGGCGMAWMGGYRGRASWCRGMTGGEEWWREIGSRGARWVMLRDEMPHGFIEQRRGEEERGREREPVEMERECNREGEALAMAWLCSNSKEHSRRTRTPSAPLTLCLLLFVFLYFPTARNGRCSATKI